MQTTSATANHSRPPLRHSLLRRASRASSRAFTLIEILIVLAIGAMIVGLAVANFGGLFSGAKVDVARIFVTSSIQVPLETYRMHVGNYPSTTEGLQALVTTPSDKADRWRGPYLQGDINTVLIDPWKNSYQYRFPGTHNPNGYDIWSKGPDGQDGTPDDIGNWSTTNPNAIPGMPATQ